MNSLSWLLYAAEILGNLGSLLTFFGVAGLLVVSVFWLIALMDQNSRYPDEWSVGVPQKMMKIIWVPCTVLSVAMLFPSSNTIYAIAASEMGERAMTTPTFGKATEALNAWLDKQIEGAKKKDNQ